MPGSIILSTFQEDCIGKRLVSLRTLCRRRASPRSCSRGGLGVKLKIVQTGAMFRNWNTPLRESFVTWVTTMGTSAAQWNQHNSGIICVTRTVLTPKYFEGMTQLRHLPDKIDFSPLHNAHQGDSSSNAR
jgi:hypothetical protein